MKHEIEVVAHVVVRKAGTRKGVLGIADVTGSSQRDTGIRRGRVEIAVGLVKLPFCVALVDSVAAELIFGVVAVKVVGHGQIVARDAIAVGKRHVQIAVAGRDDNELAVVELEVTCVVYEYAIDVEVCIIAGNHLHGQLVVPPQRFPSVYEPKFVFNSQTGNETTGLRTNVYVLCICKLRGTVA